MTYRPCWFVQSLEDAAFLAPDGEGGVVMVTMLSQAVPFDTEEAAYHAIVDHLDGQGTAVKLYREADSEESTCEN
jgi:hypothetical protein